MSEIRSTLSDIGSAGKYVSLYIVNKSYEFDVTPYRFLVIGLRVNNFTVMVYSTLIPTAFIPSQLELNIYESPTVNATAMLTKNQNIFRMTSLSINGWVFSDLLIFGIK